MELKINAFLGYTQIIVKGDFQLRKYEPFAHDPIGRIAQAKKIETAEIKEIKSELENLTNYKEA